MGTQARRKTGTAAFSGLFEDTVQDLQMNHVTSPEFEESGQLPIEAPEMQIINLTNPFSSEADLTWQG
jgi:hypothetical protein